MRLALSVRMARDLRLVRMLRRTPLHGRHAAVGARLVPFAGWELPVQFTSIVDEHRAVRERAGVFDVSHMGQLELDGSDAHAVLQQLLTNDLDRVEPGHAQYTLLPNDRGGVVDDLIAYRREDGYLLVVNAANVEPDAAAISAARDVSEEWAMLAVQGPRALDLLGTDVALFAFRPETVLGVECVLCGTGYTGERGCELLCRPDDAPALWDRILDLGVAPCGLGARDTLRLEACYPLNGQDLTPDRTPIEAGLAFACALDKDFPGVDVLRRQKADGPAERLVAFAMEERAIPRSGMAVRDGGVVTSGGYSPVLDQGIGLAYVPAECATPGTEISIDVRGRAKAATVRHKPFYTREEQ
jgi:aminomethyltransferase